MAHLRVWSPKSSPERTFPLDQDELSLGRDPSCTLVLGDVAASRQHARLVRTAEGWILEDCGSANGTRVGGQPITRHLLRPGDEIRLGDSRLVFAGDEAPGPRALPPPPPVRRRLGLTLGLLLGGLLLPLLLLAAFVLWRAGGVRGLTRPSVHLPR